MIPQPHEFAEHVSPLNPYYICLDCGTRVTTIDEMPLTRCSIRYDRNWAQPMEALCI